MIRVSRVKLAAIATHPDHAAGIGFFAVPISAFAVFVFAGAAVIASAWGTQLLAGRATMESFIPSFAVFVVSPCCRSSRTTMPIRDLLRHLGGALLGGLPV